MQTRLFGRGGQFVLDVAVKVRTPTQPRRRLLSALCTLALSAALPAWAQADIYPSRPITLVVGYPAGGSTDLTGRIVAEELGRILKATVVVENQAGSGGALAAQCVAKAAPDGYTLMMAPTTSWSSTST